MQLRLVPEKTNVKFMAMRKMAFVFSLVLILGSIGLYFGKGLNYGIDFEGGILMEVGSSQPVDMAKMRRATSGLGLGEVALQEFGRNTEVLIRVERQPGDSSAQQKAVDAVKAALANKIDGELSYRRVEFVGPKVSAELIEAGTMAMLLAVTAMLIYIWFRFEWQFSIGAVLALVHDVILTIGVFSIMGLEFNLSIIAAILTIIGYSMNDTVVIYDRVRENLRKFRTMPLDELLDRSVNETLARTAMTSATTLLALITLYLFGGEVIRGFTFAMMWGVVVGTYSSVFVAGPLLLYFGVRRNDGDDATEGDAKAIESAS
ncbi:MAG: protein translocase subunit SecF [Alphaproteobacteria bacterium]|jgi:preprotein translocase SecF subunit|nr:protein translocase subunit SecF [Alphaproteobacteria bacterium]MBT4018217.1 protein translocase subunit SecF [Alphaproteobacteria bacterium]MBT4966352.1 protein translocase subunit SecF [Alphaproteobacteria bacterium]MBT5160790.1 protein translocase subunit SecF [Alphaproteobacteria bacterium]MBT6384375.1 protein translocase subunit SecF [Alphaproteobacteria bacterium]